MSGCLYHYQCPVAHKLPYTFPLKDFKVTSILKYDIYDSSRKPRENASTEEFFIPRLTGEASVVEALWLSDREVRSADLRHLSNEYVRQ